MRDDLVGAVCHELANLLAGLRLQGELLADDPGPRISGLAARAGSLVGLVAPLLANPGEARRLDPAALVVGLRRELEAEGPVRIEVGARDLPRVAGDLQALHHLVLALLGAATEELTDGQEIRLSFEPEPRGVALVMEWPGAAPASEPASRLAGTALARALSEALLAPWGGRVTVSEVGGRARLALELAAWTESSPEG